MPRKKRDIRRDLRKAGFSERPGKGDHTIFSHPLVPNLVSVDGADAEHYDERNLRETLATLEEARRRQP